MKVFSFIIYFSTILAFSVTAQKNVSPISYTYKTKDSVQLDLHIYYPKKMKRNTAIPAGLILFNPVLNTIGFKDRSGGEEEVTLTSPIFHISESTPPTLIFHVTDDTLEPPSTILEFQKIMIAEGNTCEVILFGGEKHAFFNKGKKNDRPFHQTLALMKQFLIEEDFMVE